MRQEFGHYLGLSHAGGNGDYRKTTGNFVEYGDSSAIMGNDNDKGNTFTAPVRYYLGAIPTAALQKSAHASVKLRALSKGPDANPAANGYLAGQPARPLAPTNPHAPTSPRRLPFHLLPVPPSPPVPHLPTSRPILLPFQLGSGTPLPKMCATGR